MRLLAALTWIGAGMWLFVQLCPDAPVALGLIVFFALMLTAEPLFNRGLWRMLKGQSYPQYLDELAAQGKLTDERFHASRAFAFSDLDTGSRACFLDIGSQGVLCLYGQYLYDGEPADAGSASRGRRFPCRQFVLRRMKKSSKVLEMVLEGEAFEPTVIAQPAHKVLAALGIPLRDGTISSQLGYDDLLAAVSRRGDERSTQFAA